MNENSDLELEIQELRRIITVLNGSDPAMSLIFHVFRL